MKCVYLYLAILSFLNLGCEEDVVSVLGTERLFTMYGILNPAADTQYVRVFRIEDVLETNEPEPLNVVFESTNMETGDRFIWSERIVADRDGYGHIFWSPFRAQYNHAYRLLVSDPDGRSAEASVRVPPQTRPEVGEPITGFDVTIPVRFEGEVPGLIRTELSFAFQYVVGSTASGSPITRSDTVLVDYNDRVTSGNSGLVLGVNLSEAARITRERAGNDSDFDERFGVSLRFIKLDAIVANEEWNPPGGTFDPFVLVQPGVMSNVENGFGFVGAGYRVELSWQPSIEIRDAAGFATE